MLTKHEECKNTYRNPAAIKEMLEKNLAEAEKKKALYYLPKMKSVDGKPLKIAQEHNERAVYWRIGALIRPLWAKCKSLKKKKCDCPGKESKAGQQNCKKCNPEVQLSFNMYLAPTELLPLPAVSDVTPYLYDEHYKGDGALDEW